jgi:dTDP-4-amino-4,6-dideoxygalactose transaminase
MQRVKFVNLGKQYIKHREEILAKFDEISKQGAYILSEEVEEFEKNFAEYCDTRYAVSVGNGSDALFMCLLSLGIGQGDEVITVPNSFIATAWVIARTGARIVFVDVGDDMNIDPQLVEPAISEHTKAIIPVHLTGRVANMDAIQTIADKHNLFIIEDAAQATGAKYRGKRAGSFGICAGFSLHPLKNLHIHGDGGVITTDDQDLFEKLMKYRNHGLINRDECEFWGMNSRLDSIQAGIANIKLRYLDEWNGRFRQIANIYTEGLKDCVIVPKIKDYEEPIYHRYMIRCSGRDDLQRFLDGNGIETKINYPIPLHLQPAAASLGYKKGDFSVTEKMAGTILSLPIYPELENDKVYYVIEKIQQFFRGKAIPANL